MNVCWHSVAEQAAAASESQFQTFPFFPYKKEREKGTTLGKQEKVIKVKLVRALRL